jgi:hypothetical protein
MVAVTVWVAVVVETRIEAVVDITLEEETTEDANSDDDDTDTPVGVKLNVETGVRPGVVTCVCPESVDQANVMARLEATSKRSGMHTRMAVATMSGRPSKAPDIRPRTLVPKCLILLRTMAL